MSATSPAHWVTSFPAYDSIDMTKLQHQNKNHKKPPVTPPPTSRFAVFAQQILQSAAPATAPIQKTAHQDSKVHKQKAKIDTSKDEKQLDQTEVNEAHPTKLAKKLVSRSHLTSKIPPKKDSLGQLMGEFGIWEDG
jgi:hypothetical protein